MKPSIFMWKMKMTPGAFKPQYLSFYLAKYQNQGQFWNPQKQQISKLTLLWWRFDGDIDQKPTRTCFLGHGVSCNWYKIIFIISPNSSSNKTHHYDFILACVYFKEIDATKSITFYFLMTYGLNVLNETPENLYLHLQTLLHFSQRHQRKFL